MLGKMYLGQLGLTHKEKATYKLLKAQEEFIKQLLAHLDSCDNTSYCISHQMKQMGQLFTWECAFCKKHWTSLFPIQDTNCIKAKSGAGCLCVLLLTNHSNRKLMKKISFWKKILANKTSASIYWNLRLLNK